MNKCVCVCVGGVGVGVGVGGWGGGGGGIMMSLFSSRLNAHILILIQLVVLKCQLNKCKFGNVFFIITLNATCNFRPYDRSYRQPYNVQNADSKNLDNYE